MRVALLQAAGTPGDVPANLAALESAAREAAAQGAGLLVCPELFLTGYNLGDALHTLAEPADGPSARAVGEIARGAGLAVLYGYPERAGEAVYNAALLLDATARPLASYRKVHLFGAEEQRLFAPGERLALARLGGLMVAPLICYDVEFPEAVRALALAGADLVAVPTALMHPYGFVAENLVRTRAWENQLFVAYANRCGVEGGLRYVGRSSLSAPDGTVLGAAGESPALLVAEVEPAAYTASRRDNPYLHERRPGVYEAPPKRRT